LKELKGTPLSMRRKEVFRQAFPCFMPNVSMFGGKDGNALKRESLRLSQVTDNGLDFGLEEGAPFRIVMQGFQLCHEHGTTFHPSVEGFHGGFGTTVRMVEQSQLGLAIWAIMEHG
jgi:hypothetical protein